MTAIDGMGMGHAPVLPLSPNTEALLAGSAVHGVPKLVEIATKAAAGGFIVDYEPHQDATRHVSTQKYVIRLHNLAKPYRTIVRPCDRHLSCHEPVASEG